MVKTNVVLPDWSRGLVTYFTLENKGRKHRVQKVKGVYSIPYTRLLQKHTQRMIDLYG